MRAFSSNQLYGQTNSYRKKGVSKQHQGDIFFSLFLMIMHITCSSRNQLTDCSEAAKQIKGTILLIYKLVSCILKKKRKKKLLVKFKTGLKDHSFIPIAIRPIRPFSSNLKAGKVLAERSICGNRSAGAWVLD